MLLLKLYLAFIAYESCALLRLDTAANRAYDRLIKLDSEYALSSRDQLAGKHQRREPVATTPQPTVQAPWSQQLPAVTGSQQLIHIDKLPPLSGATEMVNPLYLQRHPRHAGMS